LRATADIARLSPPQPTNVRSCPQLPVRAALTAKKV